MAMLDLQEILFLASILLQIQLFNNCFVCKEKGILSVTYISYFDKTALAIV